MKFLISCLDLFFQPGEHNFLKIRKQFLMLMLHEKTENIFIWRNDV